MFYNRIYDDRFHNIYICDVKRTGLLFPGWDLLPFFLYNGITLAHFRSSGSSPFVMLSVKISLNGDAIARATSVCIVEFMLSTPRALYGLGGSASPIPHQG